MEAFCDNTAVCPRQIDAGEMGTKGLEEVGKRLTQQNVPDLAGKTLKVAVVVPSCSGLWPAQFGESLSNLVAHFQKSDFDGEHEIKVFSFCGNIMPEIRHHLIGQAIAWEATHLLMLQPELTFPADSIHQLLGRGRSIVAVNYLKNILTGEYAAYRSGGTVSPDPVSPETEEVDGVDPGMVLFNMPLFDALDLPFFIHKQIDDTPGFTEDHIEFWKQVKAKEIPIMIDHKLSQEIKSLHHGELWH